MNVYCGITTAPRPGGSLLRPTITSLKRSGFEAMEVFAEPDSDLAGVYEPVRHTKEAFGAWRNFLWAVRMGLDSGADIIAVAQDDIKASAGLREYLESTVTEPGWYSPYTPGYVNEYLTEGWARIPDSQMHRAHGACLLACKRDTAEHFIRTLPTNTSINGTDRWVTKWCKKTNTPLFYHLPSLVQHLGKESTIHPQMTMSAMRRATRYCDDVRHLAELETAPQHPQDCPAPE